MKVNPCLSVDGCMKMVNAIQNGKTPREIRERCLLAVDWLNVNVNISNEQYDYLMNTVAYLHRESYHLEGGN